MRYLLCLLIFVSSQLSLANEVEQINAAFRKGIAAVASGDYKKARENYTVVVELARNNPTHKAVLGEYLYQAAQASALACDFSAAEEMFKESLAIAERDEKGSQGPSHFFTSTWRLFEIAHFYSDRGLYAQSYIYWSKFLPRYEKMNETAARDPIAYSMILREYGHSLLATGNQSLGKEISDKAEIIEKNNAELFTRIAWYRYGANCK